MMSQASPGVVQLHTSNLFSCGLGRLLCLERWDEGGFHIVPQISPLGKAVNGKAGFVAVLHQWLLRPPLLWKARAHLGVHVVEQKVQQRL